MTIADATVIRQWRCVDGYSWRRVAELAAKTWPEWGIAPGHQLDGRDLCNRAADVLGEDGGEEPWN